MSLEGSIHWFVKETKPVVLDFLCVILIWKRPFASWADTVPPQSAIIQGSSDHQGMNKHCHWEMSLGAWHLGNVVFLCLKICPLEEKTSVLPNSLHIFNAISGTPTSTMVHGMTSSSSVVWLCLVGHLWGLALSFANSGWSPKLITGLTQDMGVTEHKETWRGTGEKGNEELCYFIADFLEES